MSNTHTIDFVAFDFKGTFVRHVVFGSADHRMNFFLVYNVAK